MAIQVWRLYLLAKLALEAPTLFVVLVLLSNLFLHLLNSLEHFCCRFISECCCATSDIQSARNVGYMYSTGYVSGTSSS